MTAPLFTPELARELDRLRRLLDSHAVSARPGDRTGTRRGGTAEFTEHRSYSAGDDVRHVDWLAYARSGQPRVKVFREDEDLIVRVVIDASASMGYGTPSKLFFAQRVAAAVAYLSLSGGQRTEILVLGGEDTAPRVHSGGPHRGRPSFGAVLAELAKLEARGPLVLADGVRWSVQRAKVPGLLLVLSDFLDRGPIERALGIARAAGHDVVALHVTSREELEPSLEGDLVLVDAESGEEITVTADAATLVAYERCIAEHAHGLAAALRHQRGVYVCATSDAAILPVVRRILSRTSTRPEVHSR